MAEGVEAVDTAEGARPLPFARVLVTGATGFVGAYLVPALAARLRPDAKLYLATRGGGEILPDGGEAVRLDMEDARGIATVVAETRPDLVIHLAGQASVGQSASRAGATWSINLCGSVALARALADTAPDCTMLFVSSAEVYGLTFNQERVTETSALRPQSAYARSKAAAEAALADILPDTARLIVARPANHSGPGQGEAFVIPAFAAQIARVEREAATTIDVGNLDAERDFLDVRDVAAAYLALLAAAPVLPPRAVFNIASGVPVRIADVLDRLLRISSARPVIRRDPARMRPSEVACAAIDASAIRRATGWAPTLDLDLMLAGVLADRRSSLAGF